MATKSDMAAFGASDAACYKWPGDGEVDRARRAAFCEGAGWAADEIERKDAALQLALVDLRRSRDSAAANGFETEALTLNDCVRAVKAALANEQSAPQK